MVICSKYIGMASECRFPMYVIIEFIMDTSGWLDFWSFRCIFLLKSACAGVDCEGKQVYSREIKVRLIRAGVRCEEMYV